YPQIRERLLATAESRRLARSPEFNFLGDTEVSYFISRRHIIFLFRSLLLSLLGVLLALVFLGVGLDLYLTAQGSLSATVTVALGLVFLAGSVLWALWSFEDWRNDYYVVTSQRVLWLEKVIGLYDSRREAPLDQVQSVNVNTTQIGRIFGYGNVNVRTFTGGILMRRANQPTKLASFVEGFRARAQILSREEEAKAMEEALDEALTKSMLRLEGKDIKIPDQPPPMKVKKETEKKPVSFREQLRNFLKVRYEEENNVITYRKHWFILIKKTWLPLAFILLLAAATTVLAEIQLVQRVRIVSGLPALVLDSLLFLGLFIWFGYEYVDWRNDIYRLTKEQIFDIERKPLGRELKKTAQIKDILSIEHERKNLIGVMLNYGDVNIKVGQTIFDFIGVYNPDQVHQDISDYRENLLRAQRKRERANEQKQMVDWLVAFYHQAEGLRGSQDESIELEWGADFGDTPDWDEFSG
ncbi:MAG TPA: PH domain-containing protein, partial [Anaerolineales bacterium]|nr:PH domain-containing protein [Anaerolineales bacterium]